MTPTMPVRMNGELFEAARAIGAITSRSAAQQISHWARIGRELESSPQANQRDIQRVLAGEMNYDLLGERDQAVVRANWNEQIAVRLAGLDLAAEFTQNGRTWTEGDEQGRTVSRNVATAAPGENTSV